ncbi:TetR/AcrR family transcriptional regulator C-terminal domain-containing protein [Dactylosporangium cerinum]|uniref:TetR/AcrR family transcriptional regulator C-terminal domain-containing protein n=1 Tax=Dactylosporangium cerinum TaxID=1434730 RepID=A0ABV9W4Q8_9ACTN
MPRPRSLTDDQIAAAALALIDRAGLAVLSMRTVAAELGMGTMSLYRYVTDREQLERLVVELVLRDVDLTPPADVPWTDQVTAVTGGIRDAVSAHPAAVPLFLTHRSTSAGVMRCGEVLLRVLAGAGFHGPDRVVAFRTLLAFLIGALTTEHLGPLSGPGTAALARLPGDDFPFLAETARAARSIGPDEEFYRGLTVVLAGLGR